MEKGGQVYPIDSINMDIRYIRKLLLVTIVTYKFFPYCFPFNYSFVSILGKVWKVTVVLNLMISLYINPNQKGVGGIMPPTVICYIWTSPVTMATILSRVL